MHENSTQLGEIKTRVLNSVSLQGSEEQRKLLESLPSLSMPQLEELKMLLDREEADFRLFLAELTPQKEAVLSKLEEETQSVLKEADAEFNAFAQAETTQEQDEAEDILNTME